MADQKIKAVGFVKISNLLDGLVSDAVQAYSRRSGNDPFYETQPLSNHKQADKKPAGQPKGGASKPPAAHTPTELNCVHRSPSKGKSDV